MFACNGILFNHESPRRGETFVTRKITRGLSNIALGLDECLYMGNINSLRDWGHARDYVYMQWLMLQQSRPDDYVIASGKQHSVRDFILWACEFLGISIMFSGSGINEIGKVSSVDPEKAPGVTVGQVIVRIDKRYFRPAEVDTLLGDASKASSQLGWEPQTSAKEVCFEMMEEDYKSAMRVKVLESKNLNLPISNE